jgi:hypothetical protein
MMSRQGYGHAWNRLDQHHRSLLRKLRVHAEIETVLTLVVVKCGLLTSSSLNRYVRWYVALFVWKDELCGDSLVSGGECVVSEVTIRAS